MSTVDVQAVNWILTAAAVVLATGRLAIRVSTNRRLHGDDCTHLLAVILLVIHGATNQVTLDAKAKQKVDIAAHLPTKQLLDEYYHLHVLNTINNVILYGIMWMVKVAFLLLYRQIFNCNKTFLCVWWGVLAFTVLSYIPPFAMVVHTCAGASTLTAYKACNSGSSFRTAKLITTCVLNVVSDVMIMALPLWMLSQLQMNIRNKLGLAFVFCVAIFCMALDILRTAEAVAQNQDLFTVIELNFTVIVFCLPTYRRLLAAKTLLPGWKSASRSSREESRGSRDWSASTRRRGSGVEVEYNMHDGLKKPRLSMHEPTSFTDVESQDEISSLANPSESPTQIHGRRAL